MTKQAATRYVKKLTAAGIEAKVYEGYSGRGMYGAQTYGVDLEHAYEFYDATKECPGLKKVRRDSLGLGMILY